MADIQDSDLFLVNRGGQSYQVSADTLLDKLKDDDLLLVNRGDQSYKMWGADFKDSLGGPAQFSSVVLTESDLSDYRFTGEEFVTTVTMADDGSPASNKNIRGWVEGTLNAFPATDEIVGVAGNTLTFATNKDLTLFESGDYVKQDDSAGYPPYSNGLTLNSGAPCTNPENAFDGACSDGSKTQAVNGTGPWSTDCFKVVFNPPIEVNSSFAWYTNPGGGRNLKWQYNDLPPVQQYVTGDDPSRISSPFTGILETWRFGGDDNNIGQGLYAIEIDGRILIDGNGISPFGIVNSVDVGAKTLTLSNVQSGDGTPVYSDYVQFDSVVEPGNPVVNGFDGSESTMFAVLGTTITVDLPEPFLNAQSVVGKFAAGSTSPIIVTLYDGNTRVGSSTFNNNSAGNTVTADPVGSTVTKIVLTRDAKPGFFYIELVDGSGTTRLIDGTGRAWSANTGNYVVGPEKVADNAKMYLKLDSSLNVTGLTDDSNYTAIPSNTLTPAIQFPAVLDNGQTPDATITEGTSIQTEVQAVNSAGIVSMESNVLTPSYTCVSGNIETDEIVDIENNPLTTLAFSSSKDISKLQPGDSVRQDNSVESQTEPSRLNPADSTLGTISDNGLTFTGPAGSGWARSYVTVGSNEKIQFEMTVDTSPAGALIGYSVEDTDGTPGASFQGAVYDTTSYIRRTGNWSTNDIQGEGYGVGDLVGATLDSGTGEVSFYKNGVYQASVTIADADKLKLYVHVNDGKVTANFGATPFAYPVEGFANFKKYVPSGTVSSVDRNADTVTLTDVVEGDGTTIYSEYLTCADGLLSLPANAFDGNTVTQCTASVAATGNNTPIIFAPYEPITGVTALRIFGQGTIQINGSSTISAEINEWHTIGTPPSTINEITFSTLDILGAITGAGVSAIEVNGSILTDGGGPRWSANTGNYAVGPYYSCAPIVFNSNVPADVTTFNAVKAALESYEGDRDTFRANLKVTLQNQGFTADQIKIFGL